jgi:hypothetical protein
LARTIEKDRIRRDQERIDAHLGEPRKRRIDLTNGAGTQNIDLLSDVAGGGSKDDAPSSDTPKELENAVGGGEE